MPDPTPGKFELPKEELRDSDELKFKEAMDSVLKSQLFKSLENEQHDGNDHQFQIDLGGQEKVVKQSDPSACGISCIRMILKLSKPKSELNLLSEEEFIDLAKSYGYWNEAEGGIGLPHSGKLLEATSGEDFQTLSGFASKQNEKDIYSALCDAIAKGYVIGTAMSIKSLLASRTRIATGHNFEYDSGGENHAILINGAKIRKDGKPLFKAYDPYEGEIKDIDLGCALNDWIKQKKLPLFFAIVVEPEENPATIHQDEESGLN